MSLTLILFLVVFPLILICFVLFCFVFFGFLVGFFLWFVLLLFCHLVPITSKSIAADSPSWGTWGSDH